MSDPLDSKLLRLRLATDSLEPAPGLLAELVEHVLRQQRERVLMRVTLYAVAIAAVAAVGCWATGLASMNPADAAQVYVTLETLP